MARAPRDDELFAFEVVRRALGVEVEHRDDGTREGDVDAVILLGDGRVGALEVTTLTEEERYGVEQVVTRVDWAVPELAWFWMVHVGTPTTLRLFHQHLVVLLRACERHLVRDPRQLHHALVPLDVLAWFEASSFTAVGFPETNRPGRVDVLPDGCGGAAFDHVDGLPAWLADQLGEPHLARKVAKLNRQPVPERHLYMRVHDSGMPFEHYYPLASCDTVPAEPMTMPNGLTHLWLVPRWSAGSLLRFGVDVGWRREHVFDKRE